MNVLLAAQAAPGISGGQIFGSITISGLALGAWIALILGVRGSDRIKINTRDKAGWWGIVTGTLSIAAGGTWADVVNGIGSIPKSVLGNGSGLGDPGLGGVALALTLITFGPRWKKLVWPALFGLSAAVAYGSAGGVWGILVNIIRMAVGQISGAL